MPVYFRTLQPASKHTPHTDKGIESEDNYKYQGTLTDKKQTRIVHLFFPMRKHNLFSLAECRTLFDKSTDCAYCIKGGFGSNPIMVTAVRGSVHVTDTLWLLLPTG